MLLFKCIVFSNLQNEHHNFSFPKFLSGLMDTINSAEQIHSPILFLKKTKLNLNLSNGLDSFIRKDLEDKDTQVRISA